MAIATLTTDLLLVLTAGLLAGLLCRRLGVSLMVGYLLVGAVVGEGGLGWVSQEQRELEYLARAGALLLLFSVGLEFSWDQLVGLSRYLLIGGSVQMVLVAGITTGALLLLGMEGRSAALLGAAASLSSTVLVFKALSEFGQASSPHGLRTIGILLFQDVALVPLMLLVPLLTGAGGAPDAGQYMLLAGKSIVLVVMVVGVHFATSEWIVPLLVSLRSLELVVLFALAVLGGTCLGTHLLGLPPAVGALAAGLMLGGNRMSEQIDTLILPFRETFAAVFFVTLGTLLHPSALLEEPILLTSSFLAVLVLKSAAAAVALRLVGLSWRSSVGMGIGLSQLGEFSFLLITEGFGQGVIDAATYNRMLFVATSTLIVTPLLLKRGLDWASPAAAPLVEKIAAGGVRPSIHKALVIGIGPIGRQIASRLELTGVEVCLIDLSPLNLYPFSQQGFSTVAGDARDPDVLHRADAANGHLAMVSVPDDNVSQQIVRALREMNPSLWIVVRCRFVYTVAATKKAGADVVISEEGEAAGPLLDACLQTVESNKAMASQQIR